MTGEISYRTVETDDYGTIARLSGNAAEWFFMFPRADYPLTAAQPETAVRERHDSTVVLCEGQIAEYADFQEIASGAFCATGHVVVDPRLRRRGTGTGLIRTMERIAVEKYAAREIRFACFGANKQGLPLYRELGYTPYAIGERRDKRGGRQALAKLKRQAGGRQALTKLKRQAGDGATDLE